MTWENDWVATADLRELLNGARPDHVQQEYLEHQALWALEEAEVLDGPARDILRAMREDYGALEGLLHEAPLPEVGPARFARLTVTTFAWCLRHAPVPRGQEYATLLTGLGHAARALGADPGWAADLVRCVCGPPFRDRGPDRPLPPGVAGLARAEAPAYALADFLEERGHDDVCLLGHLRQAHPHTLRCWALEELRYG